MDVLDLPAPQHDLTGPRISDRRLRGQLPVAVQCRPADEQVPLAVWQQVARCLEATGHAAACAEDGTDPSSVAVLAGLALLETETATALVCACLRRLPVQAHPAVRPLGARPRVVPVERTWFRLAGLLAGPTPGDSTLLLVVLDDHRDALRDWQRILLAPARLAWAAVSPGRG